MAWKLRYASHLGYRSADTPLFRESVGSLDPEAHIAFVAELGFAGVQYALARSRPVEEQERVARAVYRYGLETGCVVYAARDKFTAPLWGMALNDVRAVLAAELAAAFETAKRVNSRYVVVISGADPKRPLDEQRAAMADSLRWASSLAERAGVTLLLEAISSRNVPNLLLHHIGDARDMVKAVGSPAVRLIFDTGHVQAMDGDLLAHLDACWDVTAIVQIADNPGRLEPGSGEINFATILGHLHRRDFGGLVELEHHWSASGREVEQRGIEYLRRLDNDLKAAGRA
jgi:hydroxypyruvate isomerase